MSKAKKRSGRKRRKSFWKTGRLMTVLPTAAILAVGAYAAYRVLEPQVDYSDPAVVAQGQSLFARNCAVCHGVKAVGQFPESPRGGTLADGSFIAPALNGTGHAWHHPPSALFDIVKNGSPARGSPMVGWKGRLADEEIHAIIAYVRTLWPLPILARYRASFAVQ